MAYGRPSKEQSEDRRQHAWRLRLMGWSQERIAAELGIHQTAVSAALKKQNELLHAEFIEEAREVKLYHSACLMKVYEEAMRAWLKSLTDAERKQIVKGRVHTTEEGVLNLPDLVTLTKEVQSGNPALLAQARGALEELRSIWGYEEPKKTDLTSGGEALFKIYSGDWVDEV